MRLNCGIYPENLTDEHLFAEQRELKMLPSLYGRLKAHDMSSVPDRFTLGKGHMLFFLYKPGYTLDRYNKVFNECVKRGFKIEDESFRWDVYPEKHEGYTEIGFEKQIIAERIVEKIKSSPKPWFHYHGERVSKDDAIKLLLK